jgi:hypothetical protein
MKRAIFFGVLIFLCSGVFGASVTPGSYSINFEPGYSGRFSFEFGFEKGVEAELYVSGDLAEYVTLDKERLVGGGVVVATLNLPLELNLSGENKIKVGALQIRDENSGMGAVSDVRGLIKVNVPYPGRYVELVLKAPNANVGEPVNFSVEIFNRGEEDVKVDSKIQIFKEGSLIENIDLGVIDVALMISVVVGSSFDSSGRSPGNYSAIVSGEYGSGLVANDENPFRLGELFISIVNYTREFRADKLERFNIEVESFYNNPINDLYAEVNIVVVDDASFITPVGGLKEWRVKVLEGFLDTSGIDSENFKAEIILHYGNKTTSEVVDLRIITGYDYVFLFVIGGFLVVLGFLGWRIVVFVKRTRKEPRKQKR